MSEIYALDITPPDNRYYNDVPFEYSIGENKDGKVELHFSQKLGGKTVESTRVLDDLRVEDLAKYKSIHLIRDNSIAAEINVASMQAVCAHSGRKPLVEAVGYGMDVLQHHQQQFIDYQHKRDKDPSLPESPLSIPEPRSFEAYAKELFSIELKPKAPAQEAGKENQTGGPVPGRPQLADAPTQEVNDYFDMSLDKQFSPPKAGVASIGNLKPLATPVVKKMAPVHIT